MFTKVMVANRTAAAARVLRALRKMGVSSVAVYSDADVTAAYLGMATDAIRLGEGPAARSYLNQDAIIEGALKTGCDALHPGYGFLAENAQFAQRVIDAGIAFIGPSPRFIASMGHKSSARALAREHGMPVVQGSEVLPADAEAVRAIASAMGYPVMVKPVAGGGGIAITPVNSESRLTEALKRASSLALRTFKNGDLYLERLLEKPRHIEIQLLGDRHGNMRHVFERDCSMQRRNQKVLEEGPAPFLNPGVARRLADLVADGVRRMGYDNIGTVELLMGKDGTFAFLEMNTRLQVEHGVTEEICGVDLVEAQIRIAAGETLHDALPDIIRPRGHAIQARICAEDSRRFFPSPGRLNIFRFPSMKGARIETGYAEGNEVPPYYDSLIAKVIVHENSRQAAVLKLIELLDAVEVEGVETNIAALLRVLRSPEYQQGELHTGLVNDIMQTQL